MDTSRPSVIEIEAAWEEEIERRLEAVDRGLMSTHRADDVFAEASALFG
jgi:hypothetical protein